MKNKELKQYLKLQMDKVELKDNKEDILKNVVKKEPIETKKRFPFKILYASLSAFACFLIIGFVFLFSNNGKFDSNRATKLLSYQMIALANTIDTSDNNGVSLLSFSNKTNNEIAAEINNYLLTGEMMLNKDKVTSSLTDNDDKDYNYKYKLEVSYTDNSNYQIGYIIYYNLNRNNITGILIKDNVEFEIKGKSEYEKDEFEIELIVYQNSNDYIKISQETEVNENEYTYEFYLNNQKIKEISLEVENENGVKEMSIEIEENNTQKEFEFTYLDTIINCEYENNNNEYEIIIEIHQDHYLYRFKDEIIKILH